MEPTDGASAPTDRVNAIGKAVEIYIAGYCMVASMGELNVSTSFVDDEGVDLVFTRWGKSTTLAVQVKANTTESTVIKDKGEFSAQLKRSTFQARANYYVLFAVVDRPTARLDPIWLVPSMALVDKTPGQKKIRFTANSRVTGLSQWAEFVTSQEELPSRILSLLDEPPSEA